MNANSARVTLLLATALCAALFSASVSAQGDGLATKPTGSRWKIVKPSNTGIPGELIHLVRHAPDGRLWVGARWPFWQEGGFGTYDHGSEIWKTLVNWQTPIPSEYINDLEFEADGTAWIATGMGLVRYDGKNWQVWDPTNSPMRLYAVEGISLAPNGHVWINNSNFNAGGDAIYDFDKDSTWVRYEVPGQLPWTAPWTDLSEVFVDSREHVWVANDTLGGVAEFDGSTWTLRMANRGRLDEIAEDQLGNIWINAHGVGGDYAFFRWDGEASTRYPLGSPTTLTSDPENGTIYVGNWHGTVLRTSDGGNTIETYLTGLNQVFSIAPDPVGPDVWIGTIGAVGHFLDDGTLVRDFNSYNTGMPDYWVDYMSTDRSGFFWMATGEGGLSRFDGERWRNWGNHNAGSEPYPFAGNEPMGGAYEDRDGVHWFGGNGIARWHASTSQFNGFWNWQNNPGMGVTLFPFFAEDMNGKLFAMSEYGATYHFDEGSQLWVREPVSPYGVTGVPGMETDSQGNVWIADWFDIHRWNGAEWSKASLPNSSFFWSLGNTYVFAIGPDDVMWLGTGTGGLVRWDGTEFLVFDSSNSPIPDNHVTGVDVRDDGLIAIATASSASSSGIALIDGDPADPGDWTTYHYGASPLTHWQMTRVHFDAEGDLWISCLSEGAVVYTHEAKPPRPSPTRGLRLR